jgi:hypothetical protein
MRSAVDPAIRSEVGQILVWRSKLASSKCIAKRRVSAAVATLVAIGLLVASTSSAYGADPTTPQPSGVLAPARPAMPTPSNPALDFRTQAPEQPSIFHRWWFWTAVGAAAAATVVIIVVSSRGHAPPSTDLGNQEFQP